MLTADKALSPKRPAINVPIKLTLVEIKFCKATDSPLVHSMV